MINGVEKSHQSFSVSTVISSLKEKSEIAILHFKMLTLNKRVTPIWIHGKLNVASRRKKQKSVMMFIIISPSTG